MASHLSLSGPSAKPISGGKAKQLIVFLHGVGADGADLFGLARELAPLFPDAHFASPNAPFPCDMAPFGYQWFSLQNRDPQAMLEGVKIAAPIVDHYLNNQLQALELDDSKLAVVGFSQGTMTALYTMLRRKSACAGIVGFSGALIGAETLAQEIAARPPVCLIHGALDEVVPFAAMRWASEALELANVPQETHARPDLGHGIDGEGLEIAVEFLQKRFQI